MFFIKVKGMGYYDPYAEEYSFQEFPEGSIFKYMPVNTVLDYKPYDKPRSDGTYSVCENVGVVVDASNLEVFRDSNGHMRGSLQDYFLQEFEDGIPTGVPRDLQLRDFLEFEGGWRLVVLNLNSNYNYIPVDGGNVTTIRYRPRISLIAPYAWDLVKGTITTSNWFNLRPVSFDFQGTNTTTSNAVFSSTVVLNQKGYDWVDENFNSGSVSSSKDNKYLPSAEQGICFNGGEMFKGTLGALEEQTRYICRETYLFNIMPDYIKDVTNLETLRDHMFDFQTQYATNPPAFANCNLLTPLTLVGKVPASSSNEARKWCLDGEYPKMNDFLNTYNGVKVSDMLENKTFSWSSGMVNTTNSITPFSPGNSFSYAVSKLLQHPDGTWPTKAQYMKWFFESLVEIEPPKPDIPDNPDFGPDSGTGGGGGSWDDSSDDVTIEGSASLPGVSGLSTGFVSTYVPTQLQVRELASLMWTNDFLDTIKKMWSDPMDAIISFQLCYATPVINGSKVMSIGAYNTNIESNYMISQYTTVNCGSINVVPFFGSFLDYAPYTRTVLYLPFVGYRDVDTNAVMGKTINIKYNVDVMTGECVALVQCGKVILYAFNGNCNVQIPFTGRNFATTYTAVAQMTLGAGAAAAGTLATGGAALPLMAGGVGGTISGMTQTPPTIQRGGNVTSNVGALNPKIPYFIFDRPIQSRPSGDHKEIGKPTNVTYKLGDLQGYTKVKEVHVDGIACTEEERRLIESTLKNGIVI